MWLGNMKRWSAAAVITKTKPFKVCKHVLYTDNVTEVRRQMSVFLESSRIPVNGSEVQYVSLSRLGRPIIAEMFQAGPSVGKDSWRKEEGLT